MKLDQLIEYNMRSIFPEKSYTKWGGETIFRPLSKKRKLSVSLDQLSKLLYSLFIVFQVEGFGTILRLSCRSLAFASYKDF